MDTSAPSTESVLDPDGGSTASSTAEPAVRCWFHAKNPSNVRSAWVRERLVTSFHLRPEWGSIELTKVMAHMLHEVNKKRNLSMYIVDAFPDRGYGGAYLLSRADCTSHRTRLTPLMTHSLRPLP
jgi:hypothetical protein